MNLTEQHTLLVATLRMLMLRYRVDLRNRQGGSADDELAPENVEKLTDRLNAVQPLSWADQGLVDLGNLGDPGAYRGQWIDDPLEQVMGTSSTDDELAYEVADAYLDEVERLGTSPFDVGEYNYDDGDMVREALEAGFRGLFRAWREAVIQAIEQQVAEERRATHGPTG